MQPKRLAHEASNTVALHRVARGLHRHREPQARTAFLVCTHRQAEKPIPEAPAVGVNRIEFALAAQAPLLRMSQSLPARWDEVQVGEL